MVIFRCQPFWYAEAVLPITLATSPSAITNPGNVPSEPFTTVCGSGEIPLMVGLTIVELEGISGSITLNSPLMEAYSGTTPKNSNMNGGPGACARHERGELAGKCNQGRGTIQLEVLALMLISLVTSRPA